MALGLGLACGGCSLGSLDSIMGSSEKSETTGSIAAAGAKPAELPPEIDLAFAKAAASDVLSRGSKDSSAAWENPSSGARGTVTPIASAYSTSDGQTCRDFLASYVKGSSQAWLQGAACKPQRNRRSYFFSATFGTSLGASFGSTVTLIILLGKTTRTLRLSTGTCASPLTVKL